jgi:hypothetical protein
MKSQIKPKSELKLILARDREQQLRLWACRGNGRGCKRNRYRKGGAGRATRRRHCLQNPLQNQSDFDEAIITLADDTWSSEHGKQSGTKRSVPDRVFELLQDAIARHGTIPPDNGHVPLDTPCVKEALWRRFCEMGCISDGNPDPAMKAEADRKAFTRAAKRLLDSGLIGKWNEWVWIVR